MWNTVDHKPLQIRNRSNPCENAKFQVESFFQENCSKIIQMAFQPFFVARKLQLVFTYLLTYENNEFFDVIPLLSEINSSADTIRDVNLYKTNFD